MVERFIQKFYTFCKNSIKAALMVNITLIVVVVVVVVVVAVAVVAE